MKFEAKSIPHSEQRYPTLGDYWTDEEGVEHLRTTEFPDWRHEFLILFHELVESTLCRHRGVPEPEIKAFDERFETAGKEGEPGDARDAPYYHEHQFAQAMEMMMAQELDVNWCEYEAELERFWRENT